MFFYPFSYRQSKLDEFADSLEKHGYTFYQLSEEANEANYYGENRCVPYETLKQYFYPFIEDKLLAHTVEPVHFNRFSKVFQLAGHLQTSIEKIPFQLISADVLLCPFGIGFLVIRTELQETSSLSSALQFAHLFRILEGKSPRIDSKLLTLQSQSYETLLQLIHNQLAPMLEDYYVDYAYLGENASKMPFFEDERMFVSSYIELEDGAVITDEMLYRCGQLNGYDSAGNPYISSTNPIYIEAFVARHSYRRWAPNYYIVISLHTTCHVTNEQSETNLCSYYGTQYYNVILHYFYKMMLLKLSFEHSELKWEKDKDIVEELIEDITKFASRYYFIEVSVRSEGKELSRLFRAILRIDDQYREIKETLDELYRVQEDQVNDRQNDLLFLLTIFSMISGIYGMNLVIDMLADPFDWSALTSFTVFEWIALALTIIGLVLALTLACNKFYSYVRSYFDKKKRKQKR